MDKKEMTLRMDLTRQQFRAFAALTRYLGLVEVARIAHESGDVDIACILSALGQLRCALSSESDVEVNSTGIGLLPASGRSQTKTLKRLEAILRCVDALDEFEAST